MRDAQEAYERTDVGTIRKNIKSAFEEWSTKGEFEKQTDYDERLKSQSVNKFTQISTEQIKKISKVYLLKELLPYNSEKEHFTVKFRTGKGVEWQSEVNILIAAAENFKKNFPDFKTKVNDYDWSFVEHSLCPTAVTLLRIRKDGHGDAKIIETHNVIVCFPNQTEITVPFDELSIENPYLKGYVFKYSDAKAIEEKISREKFIQDSIVAREQFVRDSIQQEQNEIKQIQDILVSNCRCGYNVPFIQIIGFNNKGAYSNFLGRRTNFSNIVSELKNIYSSFNNSHLYITTAEMVDFINACKQKPYYSKVIDLVVGGNAWLWKEYQKNGKYFKSKVEFYDAYISDNYKQILKENKKKK